MSTNGKLGRCGLVEIRIEVAIIILTAKCKVE